LVIWGNWRRWHQRWMDYRLVAELVRQLRFLIPVGGARPFPRLPPYLSFENPINSWMYWHLRSIDRAVGLPNAKVDSKYLRDCLTYIIETVRGQIRIHHADGARSERIERRLHFAGIGSCALAGLGVFSHLLWDELLGEEAWLIVAAGFPAIGE